MVEVLENCITIEADNITFHGNGYTIQTGVLKSAIYANNVRLLTIKNQTITAGEKGIEFESVNETIIANSTFSSLDSGIVLSTGRNITVENVVSSSNNVRGIYLITTVNSTIRDSTISSNDQNGVLLSTMSDSNHIYNNTITGSNNGIKIDASPRRQRR